MGNLCGKSSQADDPFSLPVQNGNAHAPIPSRVTKQPPQIRGPGRTVGAAAGAAAGEVGVDDPRTAAARAAEVGRPNTCFNGKRRWDWMKWRNVDRGSEKER